MRIYIFQRCISILIVVVFISVFFVKVEKIFFINSDTLVSTLTLLHKKTKITVDELNNWQSLDFEIDTIPGTSLNKAYEELLKDKKGQEIVVAVLDTDPDLHHEDLEGKFWVNANEIPNNGIDDDNNGYIDDIHGWNFVSNSKGESLVHTLMEKTRIVRKYQSCFKSKKPEQIREKRKKEYQLYKQADSSYTSTVNEMKDYIKRYKKYKSVRLRAFNNIINFLSDSVITLEKLKTIDTKDSLILKEKKIVNTAITKGFDNEYFDAKINNKEKALNICMNLIYDNRAIIGDNINDIKDIKYGSPILSKKVDSLRHSTAMCGIIAANRKNNIGIKGISDNVKIMPLYMTAIGDYTDKDMALAIRYAVDNGAKVINLSQGKDFSINENWVQKAFVYAESKDVLIVKSAGNDNLNLDHDDWFPKDTDITGNEFVNNTIIVGANTYTVHSGLKRNSSGYGKKNVDLFAPGYKIRTLQPKNKYKYLSGTSHATAIMSGIAALIRSHYPDLSAHQVKQILMNSGVSYNIEVEIKQQDGTKKMVPFSELSKSGKIVNAYNALLMAEEISKGKK